MGHTRTQEKTLATMRKLLRLVRTNVEGGSVPSAHKTFLTQTIVQQYKANAKASGRAELKAMREKAEAILTSFEAVKAQQVRRGVVGRGNRALFLLHARAVPL